MSYKYPPEEDEFPCQFQEKNSCQFLENKLKHHSKDYNIYDINNNKIMCSGILNKNYFVYELYLYLVYVLLMMVLFFIWISKSHAFFLFKNNEFLNYMVFNC